MNARTFLVIVPALFVSCSVSAARPTRESEPPVALPSPRASGSVSLEQAIATRRSVRSFAPTALTQAEVGQLLWAAQGVTEPQRGLRTVPSAGAKYPLELYAVGPDGVWHYRPDGHRVERVLTGDRRPEVAAAALGQESARQAALVVVVTGVVARSRERYGERAERYVTLEAGHAAQNVLLEVVALGLGAVPIAAFSSDADMRDALSLGAEETPYYVLAVGHPAAR